jgi:hypothetical protein
MDSIQYFVLLIKFDFVLSTNLYFLSVIIKSNCNCFFRGSVVESITLPIVIANVIVSGQCKVIVNLK